MPFPRNSLRAFLAHAKSCLHAALHPNPKPNLTFVIGNESADLDSLTSSLLYAYLRSLTTTTLHIPLLNIPSADLPLRPEFAALLTHANLSPSHLLTLDDLPPPEQLREKLPPEWMKWVLVDHNRLQGELGEVYGRRVGGVVDHHEDEGVEFADGEGERVRVIEKCGSCTSLVVRAVRGAWDGISASPLSSGAAHGQGDDAATDDAATDDAATDDAATDDAATDDAAVTRTWDAQVAKLALGSILVDTRNLADASKTTETDREAVRYLEAKIAVSPTEATGWDRGTFYAAIDAAKADVGALTLEEILRKDYKAWEAGGGKLGMSSVVKPLEFLVRKAAAAAEEDGEGGREAAFEQAISTFMTSRTLSLYAIMTASTTSSGDFQRQLLLQTAGDGGAAAQTFEKRHRAELRLASVAAEVGITAVQMDGRWRMVWRQGNVGASRKQVAPMLRNAMAGR